MGEGGLSRGWGWVRVGGMGIHSKGNDLWRGHYPSSQDVQRAESMEAKKDKPSLGRHLSTRSH